MERASVSIVKKKKLAVIIDKKMSVGGGFNQALNAAQQISRIANDVFEVKIYTTVAENVNILKKIDIEADLILQKRRKSTLERIKKRLEGLRKRRFGKKQRSNARLERDLRTDGIDLVYFTSPSGYALDLQSLPYIFTIWDLCHLEHPEFPEVTLNGEFEKRESLYSRATPKAVAVITDSEHTSRLAAHRYGVQTDRLVDMPFSPSPFLRAAKENNSVVAEDVLQKYRLTAGYLLYPAQFWAHKNHKNLLKALALLKERCENVPELVLVGGDQGYEKTIRDLADGLSLSQSTHFLGFVPEDDIAGLYQGAAALVMPSYFGPSNLPPLEAWAMGKPVLYPDRFASFTGKAALYFDPDDPGSIANCITELEDELEQTEKWREIFEEHIALQQDRIEVSENKLSKLLSRIASRI